MLARKAELSGPDIEAILSAEDPAEFEFDNSWLRWKDFSADITDIRDARIAGFQSFGSCSFEEPRDDLRALKFL